MEFGYFEVHLGRGVRTKSWTSYAIKPKYCLYSKGLNLPLGHDSFNALT